MSNHQHHTSVEKNEKNFIFLCFLETIQNNKVGLILGFGSASQRRRYNVTSSLIGWRYTQNDPCKGY